MAWQVLQLGLVFSVNLACKKEQNLMVKMNETSSQGAVGFELYLQNMEIRNIYDASQVKPNKY